MANSFYFYDLETSGVNPREARIMQFAGQRTDLDLQPVGEPDNFLIRLHEDVLPEPDAILITGITPQQTHSEGITETEFLHHFYQNIVQPNTIFIGFNSIRFDDEFMRFLQYRNLQDPYEWQWKDGCSRWDLLDVVRMTRALRPEGIAWPVDSSGKPTNRLELLASINKLEHTNAHDALSDVLATIEVARLIAAKQPKLFTYLRDMRLKKDVEAFVHAGQPFVYSSGKYSNEFEKTTIVQTVADHPKKNGVLVYDLRHDPEQFLRLNTNELAKAWEWKPADSTELRLPVKLLQYNRCPAIAPVGVLDDTSKKRLGISLKTIEQHREKLTEAKQWPNALFDALKILDKAQQTRLLSSSTEVDGQLYDGFLQDHDRKLLKQLHAASPDKITPFANKFLDDRLKKLIPLYKARNFPRQLSDQERADWEAHIHTRLFSGDQSSRLANYFKRIEELQNNPTLSQAKRHLLEDLLLYGQSLLPND